MREMTHQVAVCLQSKQGSFGSNEPISVLDTRRSPSPSTSISTRSSSFGAANNNNNNPPEMGICRKDEWSELQPISAEFELEQKRFGVGLDDWEKLLSESASAGGGGGGLQEQDQSVLRWISGDVDDNSYSLKQLLQGNNQIVENNPPTFPFANFTPQVPSFLPFNNQMVVNPQKAPAFDQSHEFLLKKQNQELSLHQQRSMMAVVAAKQEPPDPLPHHHQNQKQLICEQLYAAAELMQSGNFSHAQGILARLNHHLPSSNNDNNKPIQRSCFYFKEALQMQTDKCNSFAPTPANGMWKMCAYKLLSEVSPIIQFMNFTSNQTLLEALDDADYIHIVDFDIGFGAQWASFIQELPRRKNSRGNCSLKITAFASPSTHHPIELGLMHETLSQFAREIGISFELEVVNFDSFDPNSFSVSGNETVAVNFPIWSTSSHLPSIPSLLHFIKQLSPKIVVTLDRGCERTDLPFAQYLLQGVYYYEVLLESIDAANVSSHAANKIEKFLLQPQIDSMVMGKLEFPEPTTHWKTLLTAGGYKPVSLSNFAEAQADCVAKRSQVRGFRVEKRHGSLVLSWQNRELVTASAWKC